MATFDGIIELGALYRDGKMQFEVGDKTPLFVLDDVDPDRAPNLVISEAVHSAEQRCIASVRLTVAGGIHDIFVQKVGKLRGDDDRISETDIAPVMSETQRVLHLDDVQIGERVGAVRAVGGEVLSRATPAWHPSPALFASARPDIRICGEEIFGPIAAVIRTGTYEEALAVANDTEFGMSAGTMTKDRARIDLFLASIQAGMAHVNLPIAGMGLVVPFSGREHSSFGPPEKGSEYWEFFTVSNIVHAAYGG